MPAIFVMAEGSSVAKSGLIRGKDLCGEVALPVKIMGLCVPSIARFGDAGESPWSDGTRKASVVIRTRSRTHIKWTMLILINQTVYQTSHHRGASNAWCAYTAILCISASTHLAAQHR